MNTKYGFSSRQTFDLDVLAITPNSQRQEFLDIAAEGSELHRQSLIQRLTEATEKFEGSHPALTSVVTRLIDGLGQMGI